MKHPILAVDERLMSGDYLVLQIFPFNGNGLSLDF